MILNIFHSGGLWVLPLICWAAAGFFGYRAYKSSKSNSTTQVGLGSSDVHTEDNTGNVPLTSIGYFWYALALTAAGLIILISVASSYKGV